MMAAEEASLRGGWFERIINFYERWLRRAFAHPLVLGGLCAILIVISYFSYKALGTGLLPAMDEGGFVLDYVTPPGSSLQETNRMVSHMEQIARSIPEVEQTSRRTGLQLGLAAVTEANTGDIFIKLKDKRSRSVEEVIEDVRAKVAAAEPAVDVDFHQMLEDMIGDLTGDPKPVMIRLYSDDVDALTQWAPRVGDTIGGIYINGKKPIVDVDDGIDSSMSGPAVVFTVDPVRAAKAGFTTDQLTTVASAIVDGEPATTSVVVNDRPYTVRVRYPKGARASLDAMRDTVLVNSNGGTTTLGAVSDVSELPGQIEVIRDNLQRAVVVSARLEAIDLKTGITAVQKAVSDLKLPPSIRVEYAGTFKEQQKSFRELLTVLLLAMVLVFIVLLLEFRAFSAPVAILSSAVLSTSGVFLRLADYANHVRRVVVHGTDHGDRNRGEERYSFARRKPEVPVGGLLAGGGAGAGWTAPAASDRDDGHGRGSGHAAAVAGDRSGLADASAAGDRGDRRHSDFDDPLAGDYSGDGILHDAEEPGSQRGIGGIGFVPEREDRKDYGISCSGSEF